MKIKTIKKLYTLHSWVGIITGILLFVIAFTGAMSVFGRGELKLWANPQLRALPLIPSERVEQLVLDYSEKVALHYKEEVLIFLPGTSFLNNLTIVFEAHHGDPTLPQEAGKHNPAIGVMFEFDPISHALINRREGTITELFEHRETDMADFIVDFHADLHLGRPIGLLTTGILGLTMMLSIVTGIFIHRKIIRQIFTFRPRKNISLLLSDGHKVIGVWGLLFNSVIAFTGAFLGLAVVVLLPAAAFVSFGGDQEKLVETFTAMPEVVILDVAQPTQISKIIDNARALESDIVLSSLTIQGYGDKSAMVYAGISGGDSMAGQTAVYQGNDGVLLKTYGNFGRLGGFSGQVLDLMFSLHFGNFGGIFVKVIWAFLGLGTALLPLTGLMLWMERGVNAANPKYSAKTYQRFNRLIVGGCGGIVVATLALFPSQMIFKYLTAVSDVGAVIGWVFFGSWLATILWAMVSPCEKKTAKHIGYLTAALLISIMPTNIFFSASHLFNVFSNGHYVSVGIDVIALLSGSYLIVKLKGYVPKQPVNEVATPLNDTTEAI